MKKIRLAIFVAMCGIVGLLAGCNTVAGMGQDIQHGGEVVQDAAS